MKLTSVFITALADFFAHQEENKLVWPSIFIGLGAALYFSLSFEIPYPFVAGLSVFGFSLYGAAFLWYRRASDREIRFLVCLCAAAVALVIAGLAVSSFKSWWVGTPMVVDEIKRPVKISGVVDHIERNDVSRTVRIDIGEILIERWSKEQTPKIVRLTVRTKVPELLKAGDTVSMLAKLNPAPAPVLPESYDYARHSYFESIGATGFAVTPVTFVATASDEGFSNGLENLRQAVSKRIEKSVQGPSQGIVVALMTGERASISDEDWQSLRASGLAHIISISGLHVALVAAPVFFLVRLFLAMIPAISLRMDVKKIAALAALLVCALYVGFVVPSVPTTRALLMTGVALLAIMMDRSPFSMRLVGFSALLILIFSPESIWSVSFQMSFAAVTALVVVAGWMRPTWSAFYREGGVIRKGLLWLGGALLTSFVASLATMPFVFYHFQQIVNYSILGNMLAMPVSGFLIMPMVILSFVLMPFGLESYSLEVMSFGVDLLLEIARFVEQLPYAMISAHMVSPWFLYLIVIGSLTIILFQGAWRFVGVVAILCGIGVGFIDVRPVVLVSQDGQLVLIRDGDHGFISSNRSGRFLREAWQKQLGLTGDTDVFPKEGRIELSSGGSIGCDSRGCRIEVGGQRIAYGRSLDALANECTWANVFVSSSVVSPQMCGTVDVFDKRSLRRQGAVALMPDGQGWVSAHQLRGQRPWTQRSAYGTRTSGMSGLKMPTRPESAHGQE